MCVATRLPATRTGSVQHSHAPRLLGGPRELQGLMPGAWLCADVSRDGDGRSLRPFWRLRACCSGGVGSFPLSRIAAVSGVAVNNCLLQDRYGHDFLHALQDLHWRLKRRREALSEGPCSYARQRRVVVQPLCDPPDSRNACITANYR
jgi:hypothetical protein